MQYKRKYEITIEDDLGNKIDVSNLRCTFHIEKAANQCPWYADISIWNANVKTRDLIINEGVSVTVKAGYENNPYGVIYKGQVFQPLFDRQNVTDYIVTLHCISGLGILSGNVNNMTIEGGYDYNAVIAAMSKNASTPFELGGITDLGSTKAPRGKVIFGEPKKILRDMAQEIGAQFWVDGDDKLHMSKLDDSYEDTAIVITPENGLIGTPQQIQNGVAFTVLLNPNLDVKHPYMVVKIDNSVIRQQKINQGQLVSPLDQDGQYKIIKVVHDGDTRGNNWYTQCVGINLVGNVTALLAFYGN